jgi:hypothetical protein
MRKISRKTKPVSPETIPSARLKECFQSGGVLGLFPLLKTWSKKELKALLKDVEVFHQVSLEKLERKSKEMTVKLKPIKERKLVREAVKYAHEKLALRLLIVCSEIDSVAIYYLKEGKKK